MNSDFCQLEKKGFKFGLLVTAAFLLLFIILCLTVRFNAVKYQEITIQLDNVPVVKEKKPATVKKGATYSGISPASRKAAGANK